MGGTGIPGDFERHDRRVCGKPGASGAADGAAMVRGVCNFRAVPNRSAGIAGKRDGVRAKMVALLAALVSASFLFVLFRGAGVPRACSESGMGGRETDRVRLLADGRASFGVAGTVRDASAKRFFSAGVPDVLRLSAGARRRAVRSKGLGRILGGDDVFGGGICHRVCDRYALSDRKPVVRDGGMVERAATGRAIHGDDYFHRTFWASARGGVSFGARGGIGGGAVGSMASPEMAILGDAAAGGGDVRVNGVGKVSLRGGCAGGHGDRDAGLCARTAADADAECDAGQIGRASCRERVWKEECGV